MSARSRFALTLLIIFASTACTAQRARPAGAGGLSRQVVVDVENRTWENLTIYLVPEGGGPMRLGRVESLRRRRFEVMAGLLIGSVQFQATRIAGNSNRPRGFVDPSTFFGSALGRRGGIYITHPFSAMGEQALRWVIGPETQLSSVTMS